MTNDETQYCPVKTFQKQCKCMNDKESDPKMIKIFRFQLHSLFLPSCGCRKAGRMDSYTQVN